MRKTCIVNNDFPYEAMRNAAQETGPGADLAGSLRQFIGARHCWLTSNGFTSLSVILQALRENDRTKTEVILPAYTAPGLVLPVKKLGFKVRLCDISLKTFTLDCEHLSTILSNDTLAIVAVDMFGIPAPVEDVRKLAGSEIAVIEDAAQSLGSESSGRRCGSLSGLGFGSFGRGKNFSLYGGGFISVNDEALATLVERSFASLPGETDGARTAAFRKFRIFSALTHPSIYPFMSPLLNLLRSRSEQEDFSAASFSDAFRASAGGLFELWQNYYEQRIENGRRLFEGIKKLPGKYVPSLPSDTRIAFNRFPVTIDDPAVRAVLMRRLARLGVESSIMYGKAVHQIYDLGCSDRDLPNASYLAAHLLTLPVHGQAANDDLNRTIRVFSEVLSS